MYCPQGTLRNGNYSPYTNGHHATSTPHVNTAATPNTSFNVSAISDGDLSLAHSPAPEPQVRSLKKKLSKSLKTCSVSHKKRVATHNCLSCDYGPTKKNYVFFCVTYGMQVRNAQLQPRSLVERARMNVGWLDSSLSIMEQGKKKKIKENTGKTCEKKCSLKI